MPVGAHDEGERPPWLRVRIGDIRTPAAELADGRGGVVARGGQVSTLTGLLAVSCGIVQSDRGRSVGRSDFQPPGSPTHVLVGVHRAGKRTLHHHEVGELVLRFEKLTLDSAPSITLSTYIAEPGSPTAERLQLLAAWTASQTAAKG